MRRGTAAYRAITVLYPKEFRSRYRNDLVALFDDLVRRDGVRAAWRRTLLDLLTTIPRYRLESVMTTRRTTATLFAITAALAAGAIAALAMGFGPVAVGALVLAVALGVAERSRLARSMRPENSSQRRRMLSAAAILALCCLASLAIGLIDLGGRDSWPTGRLIVYNSAFLGCGIGALACLGLGLRRPVGTTS